MTLNLIKKSPLRRIEKKERERAATVPIKKGSDVFEH